MIKLKHLSERKTINLLGEFYLTGKNMILSKHIKLEKETIKKGCEQK